MDFKVQHGTEKAGFLLNTIARWE